MLNDDPDLLENDLVDVASYSKVIRVATERPPCDTDEPRMWTLTHNTARFLSDKKSPVSGVLRVLP
jgi:hypothetical protein